MPMNPCFLPQGFGLRRCRAAFAPPAQDARSLPGVSIRPMEKRQSTAAVQDAGARFMASHEDSTHTSRARNFQHRYRHAEIPSVTFL
jgi:hypothetical protein